MIMKAIAIAVASVLLFPVCFARESRDDTPSDGTRIFRLGVYYGLVSDPTSDVEQPIGSLPMNARDAGERGFVPNGDRIHGRGYRWVLDNDDVGRCDYPFRLYFPGTDADPSAPLVGFDIIGPQYEEGEGKQVPVLPRGATYIGNGLISYGVTFFGKSSSSSSRGRPPRRLHGSHSQLSFVTNVGGVKLPATSHDAEAQGWLELACFEPMGGSHYVAEEYLRVPNFQAIYDKYGGSGRLNSLNFVFGPTTRSEFDGPGNPFISAAGCTVTFGCKRDAEECLTRSKLSTMISTMHVYFADPSKRADGTYPIATCQLGKTPPTAMNMTPGVTLPLSLCGSPGDTCKDLMAHLQPFSAELLKLIPPPAEICAQLGLNSNV